MRLALLPLHLLVLLLGAAVAVGAVAVHRTAVRGLPLGLLLALAATLVAAWGLRQARPRLAASYAAGWLVTFGFAVAGQPEGDFVIATDLNGYVLTGLAFLLVVVGIAALGARDSRSEGSAT